MEGMEGTEGVKGMWKTKQQSFPTTVYNNCFFFVLLEPFFPFKP